MVAALRLFLELLFSLKPTDNEALWRKSLSWKAEELYHLKNDWSLDMSNWRFFLFLMALISCPTWWYIQSWAEQVILHVQKSWWNIGFSTGNSWCGQYHCFKVAFLSPSNNWREQFLTLLQQVQQISQLVSPFLLLPLLELTLETTGTNKLNLPNWVQLVPVLHSMYIKAGPELTNWGLAF